MSYRLIDSNAIADKNPEVNDMPCVFADLPNGLDGSFIDVQPVRHGRWIDESVMTGTTIGGTTLIRQYRCSECGNLFGRVDDKFCGLCGAKMDSL